MNRKVRRENMATVPLRPIDGTSSIKKAVNMPMLCQKNGFGSDDAEDRVGGELAS